ncbi:MAG: CDP-glucose 4,6-dehydratase, partial [Bacteroidetes bacterium]
MKKFGFKNIYRDKKVLITGHTGFKGSWLSTWLLSMGAHVVGLSNNIPTSPSLFELLKLEKEITHYFEDVRNKEAVREIIINEKPDFIFHLAAQPIVLLSYEDP